MAMKKIKAIPILASLIIAGLVFTTCESPMGLGEPIDFEPPVLTLDPGFPSPMHVNNTTTLTGTVTDNIRVDRVIAREAGTTEELFKATISGNRWSIVLNFSDDNNGNKINMEIVAFDGFGNSGEMSIKALSVIVDTRPPVVEQTKIQRSLLRWTTPDTYNDLFALKTNDPNGEKKANVEKYQNGWFHINAKLIEDETRIETVELKIFDYDHPSVDLYQELITLPDGTQYYDGSPLEGSKYSPSWLIKEEVILNNGITRLNNPNYLTDYYDNKTRRYYRIQVTASDKTGVPSVQEVGYMCMWVDGDKPKAVLDDSILDPEGKAIVAMRSAMELTIFDDDNLGKTWAGLLTREQWDGKEPIYATSKSPTYSGGVYIGGASSAIKEDDPIPTDNIGKEDDSTKLKYLYDRLVEKNFEIHDFNLTRGDFDERIVKEMVKSDALDEKVTNIMAGQASGEFILFIVSSDKKLDPHEIPPPANAEVTSKTMWSLKKYDIQVMDENAPLIVFDTSKGVTAEASIPLAETGECPEENTFPQNLIAKDERMEFVLSGYTLRENATGKNTVRAFRMAWIPYDYKNETSEKYVKQVQNALAGLDESGKVHSNGIDGAFAALPGVQYWDFPVYDTAPSPAVNIGLYTGTTQEVSGGLYKKQAFNKYFDILGGTDDVKNGYRNFHYNPNTPCTGVNCTGAPYNSNSKTGCHQNENKLFIFFAEDNHGHRVYRQLRLLPNKTPPKILVFDITHNTTDPAPGGTSNPIPNVITGYNGVADSNYFKALNDYNMISSNIKFVKDLYDETRTSDPEKNIAVPFKMYPKGTELKYYVTAEGNGDLKVNSITMTEISTSTEWKLGENFSISNQYMTFMEYYPDQTQRVFYFEAVDQLGNTAQLMRTVSVTNAARLESITTTTPEGTYGIGTKITLKANFSGQIKVTPTANGSRPKLNIRFPVTLAYVPPTGVTVSDGYAYQSIECNATPVDETMYLEFEFTVPEYANGILETMYEGSSNGGTDGEQGNRRPLTLPSGTKILDILRDPQSAFIPGYSFDNTAMPNWITKDGSLQDSKTITLNGIRPEITKATAGGKTPLVDTQEYYFKTNETIEITLSTNGVKDIRPGSVTPRLQYKIDTNLDGTADTAAYNAKFLYSRPGDNSKELVFSLLADKDRINIPGDGQIVDITLYTDHTNPAAPNMGTIEDQYGNAAKTCNVSTLLGSDVKLFVKQAIPAAPAAPGFTLGGKQFDLSDEDFNAPPELKIPASVATFKQWENTIEYSINGGLSWYPPATTSPNTAVTVELNKIIPFPYGTIDVRARYKDLAGNEGTQASRKVTVWDKFPKLIAVGTVEGSGWYPTAKNSLLFQLNFADQVKVWDADQVSITLKNRNASNSNSSSVGAVNNTFEIVLPVKAEQTNLTGTIEFEWNSINSSGKEMRDGLYISHVNLVGLQDKYGNKGRESETTTIAATTPGNIKINNSDGTTVHSDCPNLPAGVRVDALAPKLSSTTPAKEGILTATTNSTVNRIIVLTFNEPVIKGSGTITVRPRGNYAIPAVFETESYYQYSDSDPTKDKVEKSPGANRTYVPSLLEIHNSLSDTDKNALAYDSAANLNSHRLNERTGQSAGPYKLMTQGLVSGRGYTGNYTGTNGNTPDAAMFNTTTGFMVPDLKSKWVLDYQYGITQDTAVVNNIRTALTKAKFRWQEVDVVNSNVVITTNASNQGIVTITLSEPLLRGLQWDVYYPAGTFMDSAENVAVNCGYTDNTDTAVMKADNDDYWLWSSGVQAPVIRVNRRSYDARDRNWSTPIPDGGGNNLNDNGTTNTNNTNNNNAQSAFYRPPTATGTWTNTTAVTDDNGWGIGNFNTVHYRVDCESPGYTLRVGAHQGSPSTTATGVNTRGAVTAAWTGNVSVNNSGASVQNNNDWAWNRAAENVPGTWVLNNLIRRSRTSGTQSYYVDKRDGSSETRQFERTYRGYRSYNRDYTLANLEAISVGTADLTHTFQGSSYQSTLGFNTNGLEASKSYIAAQASINGYTTKGYEGLFRTVIVLNYDGTGNVHNYHRQSDIVVVEGSNVKNGMPSVAGFPVRDAEEKGDARFVKAFYKNQTANRSQFYWVSTEIVCEWYFLSWGGGRSHQNNGEVNNYLTVGYGDLTYGHNIEGW